MSEIPKGYQLTRLGLIPEDWDYQPAGHFFSKKTTKGENGYEIFSVTIDKGLVKRSSLDREFSGEVSGDKSLLVEKGDLAYNMMRMWQGAVGLAQETGIVSPAYVVMTPKKMLHPQFAFYCLKFPVYNYFLKAYSYGLTNDRLRLYFKDFSLIPFALPPLLEQEKIVEIIQTWDEAISKQKALIEQKVLYKKGLMQKLLSGEVRFSEFIDTWQLLKLTDICSFSKGQGLSKEKLSSTGKTPCILYGELYTTYSEVIHNIQSKTDANEGVLSKIGDILIPASTTTSGIDLANAVAVNQKNILLGGDINILHKKVKHSYDSTFLAYYLTHMKKRELSRLTQGTTIIHLYGKDFKNLSIYLPSLPEQQKIAKVLLAQESEIDLLKRELSYLRHSKKAIMQKLLTGQIRVK